jgi:cellulose synthase/poly-beta-1,6-N-acetylglucosamine synthase-like glycosyltransferase/peptidoglycan/xylan/chitin deacetylase (PgdA/CDA1 family)
VKKAPKQRKPKLVTPLLALTVLVCALLLNGYVREDFAVGDHQVRKPSSASHVPRAVVNGGPVLDTTGAEPRSYHVARRTIALTFDDGPSRTWTPRILKVLARHRVPATFFVTGEMAARYPGLVKGMVRDGHELGVHTFSHPDLVGRSPARVDRELSQTQLALAGASGVHSSLFRPPYLATARALDNRSWPLVRQIGRKGYVSVFIDLDTKDWELPGVRSIVESAIPDHPGDGAIVLLHDAGGDRSQTVAALDLLIPRLQKQGYRFTTVTGAIGAPSANHPVHGAELWQGRAFVGAVQFSETVVPALAVLLTIVGALVLLRFAAMLVLARRHARKRRAPGFSFGPPVTDPVSVIVPAYNERECIAHTINSLMVSDHPIEIVVVDDGSTDGTADIVEEMATRLPNARVRVVRQENAGKPAALNNGVANARHDLIVMMDGDTVFEPSTVRELVQPFADPRIGAVAGNAKVGNRGSMIGRWQHIEYVMGFNLDRRMYDLMRCMPTIPGAVGGFRRTALDEVGGMSDDTLAEDTDVTMAMHRAGWHVVYAERARAWTEAPGSLRQLWKQRYRWAYGTMQAMWKHRRACLDRGHSGRFGRVGLPLIVLYQILTPLLAPLIDIFALYGLLFMDPVSTALAWTLVLGVQTACAAYAFHLDGERLRDLWPLPLQQVIYRQLMYLVLLQSTATAFSGGRLGWHKLRRTGEVGVPGGGPGVPSQAAAPAEEHRTKAAR